MEISLEYEELIFEVISVLENTNKKDKKLDFHKISELLETIEFTRKSIDFVNEDNDNDYYKNVENEENEKETKLELKTHKETFHDEETMKKTEKEKEKEKEIEKRSKKEKKIKNEKNINFQNEQDYYALIYWEAKLSQFLSNFSPSSERDQNTIELYQDFSDWCYRFQDPLPRELQDSYFQQSILFSSLNEAEYAQECLEYAEETYYDLLRISQPIYDSTYNPHVQVIISSLPFKDKNDKKIRLTLDWSKIELIPFKKEIITASKYRNKQMFQSNFFYQQFFHSEYDLDHIIQMRTIFKRTLLGLIRTEDELGYRYKYTWHLGQLIEARIIDYLFFDNSKAKQQNNSQFKAWVYDLFLLFEIYLKESVWYNAERTLFLANNIILLLEQELNPNRDQSNNNSQQQNKKSKNKKKNKNKNRNRNKNKNKNKNNKRKSKNQKQKKKQTNRQSGQNQKKSMKRDEECLGLRSEMLLNFGRLYQQFLLESAKEGQKKDQKTNKTKIPESGIEELEGELDDDLLIYNLVCPHLELSNECKFFKSPPTDLSQAKKLYNSSKIFFNRAKKFYTFTDHVFDHIEIIRNLSSLSSILMVWEDDFKKKCQMLQERINILEPLWNKLEINKDYLPYLKEIALEIARICESWVKIQILNSNTRIYSQKVTSMNQKSIQYNKSFLLLHQPAPKKMGNLSSKLVLRGKEEATKCITVAMNIASSYAKIPPTKLSQQKQCIVNALRQYTWISKFFDEHPKLKKHFLDEQRICEQMIMMLEHNLKKL
ncbi:kif1-binding protein [Anaeramoeba flamelloides]|uniref:KIF-binding protein n=1 Tax=Anaeramoeba flamelloides TaxID=1746091 RepID=A0ABQ8XUU4_9EUKA|nr:kif1-binding protein [Anaeramoeba flamelloides]